MKTFLLVSVLLLTGCTRYVQVESALVDQARKGVAMTSVSLSDRAKIVAQYHALQRKLLDDAFDQDARDRPSLSADWVIEHRHAYAAGLDALATANRASDDALASDQRTLDAIDKSLQQLKLLQSIETKWTSISENDNGQP